MLKLDRATLAKFLPNPQAISAFEKVFTAVGETLPANIEEANALAAQAQAAAAAALAMVAAAAQALEQLATAPATVPPVDPDETAPRPHLGTMSTQNHDAVDITGGTAGLDAGTVGAPSLWFGGDRTTGIYRSGANILAVSVAGTQRAYFDGSGLGVWGNVSASGQLVSNVASGTPPLVVSSTTLVPNLYVARAQLADNATNATRASTADSLGTAGLYPPDASDLATAITLVNYIKSRNTSKGV